MSPERVFAMPALLVLELPAALEVAFELGIELRLCACATSPRVLAKFGSLAEPNAGHSELEVELALFPFCWASTMSL